MVLREQDMVEADEVDELKEQGLIRDETEETVEPHDDREARLLLGLIQTVTDEGLLRDDQALLERLPHLVSDEMHTQTMVMQMLV